MDSGSKSGLLPTMPITGEAAGSQHGTSSSSGMNLEKCEDCEEDPYSDAAVFCRKCTLALCTSCDEDKHNGRKTRLHERISIVDRRKELEVLRIHDRMRSDAPIRTGQVDEDWKNKFCYFCPNERRIIFLPRLAALVKDPKARPSLVSFIGPTGVGKSFLLKYLLLMEGVNDAKDVPVIGAPADHQSTSADIHIYAHPGCKDSADPLLYLDSEGRGGSKKPHGVGSYLLDAFMRGPTNTGDEKDYEGYRYEHVQTSYPRMLYIFSDVLCFVFSGNCREKSAILEPLLDWGKTASRGADNQHRPQLIIIFNKTDKATFDDVYDDFKKTFRTWITDVDKQQKERLELYYSKNPLVVFVPHADFDEAGKKVYSRVAKLRDAITESTLRIRSERSEGKLLFTRRQLELYMRKVAGVFSKEPNGVFDIYKAMVADSAIVGLTGYIVKFRREVEIASRGDSNSSKKFVTSLKVLKSLVNQSMLLWISRNVDFNVRSPELPPDLRRALMDAQNIIDNEMPCGAGEKFFGKFTCGTLKGKHTDRHSGVRTLMKGGITGARYEGDFRAHPEVEVAMEVYGNLVNLAENVFETVSREKETYIWKTVSSYRRSVLKEYSWLKDFTSYQVCVICLLNLPTEMLSCGHIICDKCAEEAETFPHTQTRLAKPISVLCPVCQSDAKWCPTNLPPLAGCRILSLDGGGVRGIVELLSLRAIMAYFPGMHVEDLFDIVIGTSMGGIIALALTVRKPDEEPKRLPCVIELFTHLAEKVFSPEQKRLCASTPFLGKILVHMWYESKYKNDALLGLLKQHLGEQSLLRSCVGGPRVIITACDYDEEVAAAWFTSYSRPSSDNDEAENGDTSWSDSKVEKGATSSFDTKVENRDTSPSDSDEAENGDTSPSVSDEADNKSQKAALREDNTKSSSDLVDGRVCDGYLFNAAEVALATSAAPTFLPVVRAGNRRWVDGGLRYNGPAMIAINEANKLWPKRQVSALISLGCGKLKKGTSGKLKKGSGKTKRVKDVLKILKLCVNIALDAEEKCNNAISHLKAIHLESFDGTGASTPGLGIRLNPTIDPCDLDDWKKMKMLIEQTEEYLTSTVGKGVVGKAANLLFAALFHLHIESDVDMHAQNLNNLRIRSCSALPEHLQVVLKNSDKVFSVTVKTQGANPTCTFDWDECTWHQDYMDLPFNLSGLPRHRPLKMVVKLHMCLPGTEKPEQYFPIPISGMPYTLKAD